MTNNEEIISRFKLELKEQTETTQRIAKLIEESKEQIETAQRIAKSFEGAAEEFARFSKQANEISKLVQKQTEKLLLLANEILTPTPSLQEDEKADEQQSSLVENKTSAASMENDQQQVDQIEVEVKSDVAPKKEKQIGSVDVELTDAPQIENDQKQVDQINEVKSPDVPSKKENAVEEQLDSVELTGAPQIENDQKQVDQINEVKSPDVPSKKENAVEEQLDFVELTGAPQIGNDQQQQQVDQNEKEKSPDSPMGAEEFDFLRVTPEIPLEGVEEYEEDKRERPIMHMNSSGTPTPRADEISNSVSEFQENCDIDLDSTLPPPPSPLGTEDGEQQALDNQSQETVDRVPSPEAPILTSTPKALIMSTTSSPLSMKSSPNAAGAQPQKVGHDQQVEENQIKLCFSLKENNNHFESTPKEINGYRWSLLIQCTKGDKLSLGTFLKCHGPVHELGIPDAGMRVRESLFIVHNWKSEKSRTDHLALGKHKESVKFEPPYSPKGVWFEMKGKQELINEGFITEDELKIQVLVKLKFHSAGSLTSGVSN